MDFNFRSFESHRSSNSFSSSPNFPAINSNASFFANEAIRVGFNGAESSSRGFFPNPSSIGFREFSIQRELEKDRIRAEIIAEEMYRRRMLEEEVRREMKFEREMALRRSGRELGFGSSSSSSLMQFEARVPLLTNFEHPTGVSSPLRRAGSESLPFQRDPVASGNGDGYGEALPLAVRLREIKELKGSIPEIDKDKAIVLAKTDATDLKRKATKPPIGRTDDSPPTGSKKPKTQDDWSCALCRVTATSEQALNDHLQGKKHKAKANGLNSQRTGFGTGPLPKTVNVSTSKSVKVPGATNKHISWMKDEKATCETSLVKTDNKPAQVLGTDKKIILLEGKKTSSKKKNEAAAMPKKTGASAKPKKPFNFFCEICEVGTYRLKVMNSHKKGKQHLAKMKRLCQGAEATSGETSALKVMVENKETDVATCLKEGLVEEDKNLNITAVNESNSETPVQRGVLEVKKKNKEPDMTTSVDIGLVEENKELCVGPIGVANELKNETEEELKSNTECADNNVTEVEEDKNKLL